MTEPVPLNEQIAAVWRVVDTVFKPVRPDEIDKLRRDMNAVLATLRFVQKHREKIIQAVGNPAP